MVKTSRARRRAQLRLELARIALSADAPGARAEQFLQVLAEAVEFDAAWLAVRDPERRRHVPVATAGDAEPLRRYFRTPEADADVEQLGLNSRRPPMLAADIPVPLAEVPAWGDHLLPAGFRAGLAAGLFTPAGRHVGFLSILSQDSSRPSASERRLVAAVTSIIATGLDRFQEIADLAGSVTTATAGVVLTRGGAGLPLPGLPGHPLLASGSPVLAAAASEIDRSEAYVSFLAAAPQPDADDFVRVTVLEAAGAGQDHLRAAVLLSPAGVRLALTCLDLRVLGWVAEGITDAAAVAAASGIPEHRVAESLAAAREALGVATATALAARAYRTGLRIPPSCARA